MRILLTLLAVGCLQAPADPDPFPDNPIWHSYTLTPDPDLTVFTQRSINRWNNASGCFEGSGCEFKIGENGVPVQYVDEIEQTLPNGEVVSAGGVALSAGRWRPGVPYRYIHIKYGHSNPERILVHELGHLRGIRHHTETGVMLVTNGKLLSREEALQRQAYSINEEVLTLSCSAIVCLSFNPED